MKSMLRFSRLIFMVLSLAVLLLAGCGGSDSTTGQVTGEDESLPMGPAVSTPDYSDRDNWRRQGPIPDANGYPTGGYYQYGDYSEKQRRVKVSHSR